VETRLPGNGDFAGLIARGTSGAGDRPLLTWYDDERDQRVELSWRTFENWVAKTANLLVEELGVGPGEHVAVMLPTHWQAPVVLAACWLAGASVVPAGPDLPHAAAAALLAEAACAVAFVHEDLLAEAPSRFPAAGPRPTLVAITGDLLGRAAADLGSAVPFARVVPGMPDHFDAEAAAPEAEALMAVDGGGPRRWTQAELIDAAAGLGGRLGLGAGDRLYSGLGLQTPAGVATGLVLPLVAGAGVVLERAPDPAAAGKRMAEERVALAALTSEQARSLHEAGPDAAAGRPGAGVRLVVEPFIRVSLERP